MNLTLVLVSLSTTLWMALNLLQGFHTFILLPLCTIPGPTHTSSFCNIIRSAPATSNQYPTDNTRFPCWLPGLSSMAFCHAAPHNKSADLDSALSNEFHHLSLVVNASSDNAQVATAINEASTALEDLVILVRHSDIANKYAIVESLKHIIHFGDQTSKALAAYGARLSSAVNLIDSSVTYTIALIEAEESTAGHVKLLFCNAASPFYHCQQTTQDFFLRVLELISSSVEALRESNSETDRALINLEEHIRGVIDIVGGETFEVSEEIGKTLDMLWTRLGGNRSLLAKMNSRATALSTVGNYTTSMRNIVTSTRKELDGLQKVTNDLRDVATEPLLISGPLPRFIVLDHLLKGSMSLKHRFFKPVETTIKRSYLRIRPA